MNIKRHFIFQQITRNSILLKKVRKITLEGVFWNAWLSLKTTKKCWLRLCLMAKRQKTWMITHKHRWARGVLRGCNPLYIQNHAKCSRPLCSLPGLQGQNFFADAIINFLMPFKSISDKNWYDQLFINEVVKIFTFHFDESIIKFYLVKVFQILMKFLQVVLKYHKIFLVGTRKKITSINFSRPRKKN